MKTIAPLITRHVAASQGHGCTQHRTRSLLSRTYMRLAIANAKVFTRVDGKSFARIPHRAAICVSNRKIRAKNETPLIPLSYGNKLVTCIVLLAKKYFPIFRIERSPQRASTDSSVHSAKVQNKRCRFYLLNRKVTLPNPSMLPHLSHVRLSRSLIDPSAPGETASNQGALVKSSGTLAREIFN